MCSALGGREWGFRGCCSVQSVRAGAVSVGTCSEEGIASICSVPHLLLFYLLSLVNSTDHVDSISFGHTTFDQERKIKKGKREKKGILIVEGRRDARYVVSLRRAACRRRDDKKRPLSSDLFSRVHVSWNKGKERRRKKEGKKSRLSTKEEERRTIKKEDFECRDRGLEGFAKNASGSRGE